MASCHHHNQHPPSCCCSHRCNSNLPPPPSPIDPILLQSIVSQLLQNPQTAHLYSPTLNPAFFASSAAAFDSHPCSSQYSHHKNLKHPKQKQPQPHRAQFEDQSQNQYSALSSLLQRIDILESSLHRFSSASAFSLRHVAARTIQIHFRAYLVRRSKALRELKELASIKSALNVLKSSLSLQNRVDFFSLSREALNLINRLESIQSGDQMVRDSKSSIRRDIGQFLELVDEICAEKHTISVKTVRHIRMPRNDDKSRVSYNGRENSGINHRGSKATKQRNLDNDEKKLLDNLKERVEKIQHMSKALKDEDDSADTDDDDSGAIASSKMLFTDQRRTGNLIGKHRQQPDTEKPEKRVWFSEGRNTTRVYDIHENGDRREESVEKKHEEDEEVESDIDENDAESAEGSEDEEQNGSLDGSSQSSEAEETRRSSTNESDKKVNLSYPRQQRGKLILSAPPPVKMEGRA